MMYDELIRQMRACCNGEPCEEANCGFNSKSDLDCIEQLLTRAADAIEELQLYVDLYKDLADKAERVAREVIDKYPKWTSCSEQLPDYDKDVLVTDFYDSLGWCMHVWYRIYDGKGIDCWEAEDGHFVSINYADYWMPLPEPPESEE